MSQTSAAAELLTWLSYAASIFTGLVCLGVIGRAIFMPGTLRRAASCGACRHELVDTSTNRCPECGGLLTKVGVTTPALAIRLRGGLGWALLAWTVIAVMGGRDLIGYVTSLNPSFKSTSPPTKIAHTHGWRFTPDGDSPARALRSYKLDVYWEVVEDLRRHNSTIAKRWLIVHAPNWSSHARLNLNTRKGTFEIVHTVDPPRTSGNGQTRPVSGQETRLRTGAIKNIDEATIKTMYEAAQIDTSSPAAAAGIADVLKIVKRLASDPPPDFDDMLPRRPTSSTTDVQTVTPADVPTVTPTVTPATVVPTAEAPTPPAGSLIVSEPGGVSSSPVPSPWPAIWGNYQSLIAIGPAAALYLLGAGLITWRYRRLVR